jgi:hypothetical protein
MGGQQKQTVSVQMCQIYGKSHGDYTIEATDFENEAEYVNITP